MTTFTAQDIHSWEPIADLRYLPDDWSGTAIDILEFSRLEVSDRLKIVLREELIDARTLRLFAVWCARSVLHLANDPRADAACDVAERFADGIATREELAAAEEAAEDAAREGDLAEATRAAGAAAAAAAAAAAGEADLEAGLRPAGAAAGEAARMAARDAAWAAAWDAARDVVGAAARNAAKDAARAAASRAQVERLREMIARSAY